MACNVCCNRARIFTHWWTAAGRRALQDLALPPYTDQRRGELLSLYTQLEKRIQQLSVAQ